jgi:TIR domain
VTTNESILKVPKAFVSYSWDDDDHRLWVRELSTRLRSDGIEVTLDQWHTAPGDQLPEFMERAVRENDHILIICTPRYKKRSDGRIGGVGYEGDIMTAEALTSRNQRKFIPILRRGDWQDAAPSWVSGKYYVDLRGIQYPEQGYQDLLLTLLGQRQQAPPLGSPPENIHRGKAEAMPTEKSESRAKEGTQPIKIEGVIVDEVTTPRNDGTAGSALYAIPFQLSRRPSTQWAKLFVKVWDHPPRFTTMHRPRIARVISDRIILDGTTIGEVEQYHRDTLKLVVERVNELMAQYDSAMQKKAEEERQRLEKHQEDVKDISKRLKFD